VTVAAAAGRGGGASFVVHTDFFDGPLDLLLHIVRRDGIDLRTLRVSDVASAYLEALDRLAALDFAVAGEHLVMAATLVWWKSLELLPRPASSSPDEPEPAALLAERLEAHAALRAAADALDAMPRVGRDVAVRSPPPADPHGRVLAPISAWGLVDLYAQIVERAQSRQAVVEIRADVVDLDAARDGVRTWLALRGGHGYLHDLLPADPTVAVVQFLAVLQSHRDAELDLAQERHLGAVEIALRRRAA
jgi:segregation and condensation protein A